MKYDKYAIQASPSFLKYEFQSEGPKGTIIKQVKFVKDDEYPEVFDLVFGDCNHQGDINYFAISDNMDSKKVLATVALTVVKFLETYPDKSVYFTGSTRVRTRLYRMAITQNLHELHEDFDIFGVINDEYYSFETGVDYEAFLIRKK